MDYYNEYSNMKSKNNPSIKFFYLKKLTQILVPVSVFTLFFSHSSLFSRSSSLVDVLVQSYDYLVSNLSIRIFTYTSERNYIFLLCNGILVLIIRTSGVIGKITPVQTSSKGVRTDDNIGEKGIGSQEKNKVEIIEKVEAFEEKGSEIHGDDDGDEDKGKEDYQEWEEEEEEEGGGGGIDDELKKKCEDFIKKVKQEILGA